jgi:hypothetical protein
MTCRSAKLLTLAVTFLSAVLAQRSKSALPMIAGGEIPLYPPLARAAKVQGVVHVKVTTDGAKVLIAQAEDGHRLLAAAAEENARTWRFARHEPTSFTVTYRYLLDAGADPNNPTVTLRFPTEVDISAAPLVIRDPPADAHRK